MIPGQHEQMISSEADDKMNVVLERRSHNNLAPESS